MTPAKRSRAIRLLCAPCWVIGIEEFSQRLAGHPVGTALLFSGSEGEIDNPYIHKAAFFQPAFQRFSCLDPDDPSKTVEGYPAPLRAVLVATKP